MVDCGPKYASPRLQQDKLHITVTTITLRSAQIKPLTTGQVDRKVYDRVHD